MALNIELPILQHKWIKLYNSQSEQELDEANYEECCVFIVKDPSAGEETNAEYQYSVRTTNNDNLVKGKYYSQEDPDYWSGLEIVWGYFGWEWTDFVWNGETLRGGNLYMKINTTTVKTIPDGNRLQHINNFLGSQDNITKIEAFDNSNIISAETINGYRSIDSNRQLSLDISDWNNIENAKGMFQNITLTIKDNTLNLPKAVDCSYIFSSDSENTINFKWNFPNAENLSYAFYNVVGDIILNNTEFIQNSATNLDYAFASKDTIKQINVNITEVPLVTSAKGLFAYRAINNNNNNNNISLPICTTLDYALQGVDTSRINNINFTSNELISCIGFLQYAIINNIEDTGYNLLKHLINYNKVKDWSYFIDHITTGDNKQVQFDISNYTESEEIKLEHFCDNTDIKLLFVGNSKCNYYNFAKNATLDIDENSSFENGINYKDAFTNNIIVNRLPISVLHQGLIYRNLYNSTTIQNTLNITSDGIAKDTYNILKDAKINNINMDFIKLPNVNLNFHVGEENVVNELFDFDISDNTTDFGFGEDYIGYKDFTIGEKFNYKEIKAQTINICIPNRNYSYNNPNANISNYYLINNNNFINENNIVFNIKDLSKIEDFEYGMPVNTQKIVIQSTSMKNLTIRGEWYINGEDTFYGVLINIPSLVNLDIQLERSSWRDTIEINNDILEGFLLKHFDGTINITSTKINIDNLKQSIDWWVEDNTYLHELSIKQSVYNQLDENYQSKLINHCSTLNLIQ